MITALSRLLAKSKELRESATPGPWDARCKEFSNTEAPRHIWDARCKEFSNTEAPRHIWDDLWGFIGEMNSGRYDVANAEFIAHARNVDEAKDEMLAIMSETATYAASVTPCVRPIVGGGCPHCRLVDSILKVEEIARGLE